MKHKEKYVTKPLEKYITIPNQNTKFVVRLSDYQGLRGVDLRRFGRNHLGMWYPLRFGFVVPIEQWNEYFNAIVQFNHELKSLNKPINYSFSENINKEQSITREKNRKVVELK